MNLKKHLTKSALSHDHLMPQEQTLNDKYGHTNSALPQFIKNASFVVYGIFE